MTETPSHRPWRPSDPPPISAEPLIVTHPSQAWKVVAELASDARQLYDSRVERYGPAGAGDEWRHKAEALEEAAGLLGAPLPLAVQAMRRGRNGGQEAAPGVATPGELHSAEAMPEPRPATAEELETCAVCGCSELDACLDEAGQPCTWAKPGLCSVCHVRLGRWADLDRIADRIEDAAGEVNGARMPLLAGCELGLRALARELREHVRELRDSYPDPAELAHDLKAAASSEGENRDREPWLLGDRDPARPSTGDAAAAPECLNCGRPLRLRELGWSCDDCTVADRAAFVRHVNERLKYRPAEADAAAERVKTLPEIVADQARRAAVHAEDRAYMATRGVLRIGDYEIRTEGRPVEVSTAEGERGEACDHFERSAAGDSPELDPAFTCDRCGRGLAAHVNVVRAADFLAFSPDGPAYRVRESTGGARSQDRRGSVWLRSLRSGQTLRNLGSGEAYTVVSVSWPRGADGRPSVVAVRSCTISNPSEWLDVTDEVLGS